MNPTGNYIKITKRKIHPNLQPKAVTEGMILGVVKQEGDKLKVTPLIRDTSKPIKVYTVSPSGFEWSVYTDVKDLARDIATAQSETVIKRMTEELTEEEIVKVATVPLIIEGVAWHYCQRARDIAAQERIGELKKLSRSFVSLKESYDMGLREYLGAEQITLINNVTDAFLEEYSNDFTKLYFTVLNLLLKHYPEGQHLTVRTHGILAKLLTKTAQVYRAKADEAILVSRGIVDKPTGGEYEIVQALFDVADAYAGEDSLIDYDDYNLQNGLKFFLYRLDEIRYNPETKEIEL